jgi:serine/threonine protein kinase
MAPEILEGAEGYDKSVDIWYSYYSCRALGITCIEMAEGSAPHSSENSMQAMIKIINQDPPKLKEEPWNEVLRPFVESCLQKDPYKRPTADTLLKQHKALWSKCKDGKYLVQALRIKDFPLDIEKESQSTSMMSDKEKPEKKSISLTKIQWQFELEEDEGF